MMQFKRACLEISQIVQLWMPFWECKIFANNIFFLFRSKKMIENIFCQLINNDSWIISIFS